MRKTIHSDLSPSSVTKAVQEEKMVERT